MPTPLFHKESLAADLIRKRPELLNGQERRRYEREPVELFVLYESPSDYRGKFVLRRWMDQKPDSAPVAVSSSLTEVLAKLPKNLKCLGRKTGEDPSIKDVWTPIY